MYVQTLLLILSSKGLKVLIFDGRDLSFIYRIDGMFPEWDYLWEYCALKHHIGAHT